jgi:hypothetical protein
LLTQSVGQTLDIAQGIDPAPDEPLTMAFVAQRRLQGPDLRPVAQLLQSLGQIDPTLGGVRDWRRFEFVHAHWLDLLFMGKSVRWSAGLKD